MSDLRYFDISIPAPRGSTTVRVNTSRQSIGARSALSYLAPSGTGFVGMARILERPQNVNFRAALRAAISTRGRLCK